MPKKTFHRLDHTKQERVIRAAIKEFLAHGFEQAKVETIAQNAGVAKGSIYQYFAGKKALFLYSVRWTLEYFMKLVDEQTPLKDMDVFAYFHSKSRERFEILVKEPLLTLFAVNFTTGKYGHLAKEINLELERVREGYELTLIANGKKKGTVRDDLDDQVLLLYFRGVTEQFTMKAMEMAQDFQYEPAEEQLPEINDLLEKMILLLKEGMGGVKPVCQS